MDPTAFEHDRDQRDSGDPGRAPDYMASVGLGDILRILSNNLLLLAALPVSFAIIAVVSGFLFHPGHTATSAFQPESSASGLSGRFGGLATQLGFQIPTEAGEVSPAFYTYLLTSPSILRQTVLSEYVILSEDGQETEEAGNLISIYGIEEDTEREEIREAAKELEESVQVDLQADAGVVLTRVTASSPNLAIAINRRLLELAEEYNLETRQSRAAAQRRFIEERLELARRELLDAEEAMRTFLEANRAYESSPELRFEAERLERAISLRREVYSGLAQSYEDARIAEVRNTPVLTVVTRPEDAVVSELALVRRVAAALLVGLLTGIALALGREYLRNAGTL